MARPSLSCLRHGQRQRRCATLKVALPSPNASRGVLKSSAEVVCGSDSAQAPGVAQRAPVFARSSQTRQATVAWVLLQAPKAAGNQICTCTCY